MKWLHGIVLCCYSTEGCGNVHSSLDSPACHGDKWFMAGQSPVFNYSIDVYLLYIPPDSVRYHGNKYLIGKLQPCTERQIITSV